MIKRIFRKLLVGIALFLMLTATLVWWLMYTEHGLKTVYTVAKRYAPGTLSIDQLQGTLAKGFQFAHLRWQQDETNINIEGFSFSWSLPTLIQKRTLLIHHITLKRLVAQFPEQKPPDDASQAFELKWPQIPKLPIAVVVEQLKADSIQVNKNELKHLDTTIQLRQHEWQGMVKLDWFQSAKQAYHIYADFNLSPFKKHEMRLLLNIVDPEGQKSHLDLSGSYPHFKISGHYAGQPKTLITGDIHVQQQQLSGKIHVRIPDGVEPLSAITLNGHWRLSQKGMVHLDASLKSRYEEQALQARLRINGKQLQLNAHLGNNHVQLNTDDGLQWVFNGQVRDLPALYPQGGSTRAYIDFKGRYQYHQLIELHINDGWLNLPEQGLTLKPIQLNISSGFKQWQMTGQLGMNQSMLSIQGNGSLVPEPSGTISIKGQNLPLRQTDEQIIHISPDLLFTFNSNNMSLTGTVDVPKVLIKSPDFNQSQKLSRDVIFHQQEESESSPFSLNVLVRLGDDVKVSAEGLDASLGGELRIIQPAGGNLIATGQLNVLNGQYAAYGQKLMIDKGELLFTGGTMDNPGISLQATRTFNTSGARFQGSNGIFDFANANLGQMNFSNQTVVGVEVTGRVHEPQISLFSNPAGLTQTDILAMLITGRPANQVGEAGGAMLLSAISSMNPGGGSGGPMGMLEELQKKSGLDFDLSSSNTLNRESGQVSNNRSASVGKAVTDRLYLSYNIGITNVGQSVLTLRYLLNKFLSIQVTASDNGNGIDLLYTRTRESL